MPVSIIKSDLIENIEKGVLDNKHPYGHSPAGYTCSTITLESTHSAGSPIYMFQVPLTISLFNLYVSNSPMGPGSIKIGLCAPYRDGYAPIHDSFFTASFSLSTLNVRVSAISFIGYPMQKDGQALWRILYPSAKSISECPYQKAVVYATIINSPNGQGGLGMHLLGFHS